MRVKWTDYAEMRRDQIGDYILDSFGAKRMAKFMQEVDSAVNMLIRNPNIGFIDPLFADRSATYRSIIINGLSKLVYRIDDDIIYIVGFWDTRMEPNEQRDQTIARIESDEL